MNKGKRARIESDVHAAYETWCETYDAQSNATRDLSTVALQRLVPDLNGLAVVESGCGTGTNSSWLALQCRQLIGLDFSEGMLRVAASKVRLANVGFIRCDIQKPWPVADETADLVVISLVLEHVEILWPVFHGAARAMRPGAALIITELHPHRVAADGRARIKHESEDDVGIVNFLHPVEEYVSVANAVGLRLGSSTEWSKRLVADRPVEDDDSGALVVALYFEKPRAPGQGHEHSANTQT